MSKITSKNLSYDSSLPPFLQRLQANNAGLDGRNEFQSARPKKARNADNEAEDEPVYFDEESGETLTKKEWEDREKVDEEAGEGGEDAGRGLGKKEKEKIVEVGGASRKRKAGKVVGADEEEGEKGDAVGELKRVGEGENKGTGKSAVKKTENGKAAKKGKKIKLSFGDDE